MTKTQVGYSLAIVMGIMLAFTLFAGVNLAFASEECGEWCCGCGGGDKDNSVYINVSNSGTINNTTKAEAETGENTAGGSYGGDGDIGGTIRTGEARSDAGTINVMNTVLVRVTR